MLLEGALEAKFMQGILVEKGLEEGSRIARKMERNLPGKLGQSEHLAARANPHSSLGLVSDLVMGFDMGDGLFWVSNPSYGPWMVVRRKKGRRDAPCGNPTRNMLRLRRLDNMFIVQFFLGSDLFLCSFNSWTASFIVLDIYHPFHSF